MKALLLLLLCSYTTLGYDVPDIAYDQTSATCTNVQTLLTTSAADLAHLRYNVDILIPARIARLRVIRRATGRVCDLNSAFTPLLTQKSSSEITQGEGDLDDLCSNLYDAVGALMNQLQTLPTKSVLSLDRRLDSLSKVLWSAEETCTQVSDSLFPSSSISLVQKSSKSKIFKTRSLLSDGEDQLCQDVTNAIDQLAAYLEFLVSSVKSKYVVELLPTRINSLTTKNADCLQSSITTSIPTPKSSQLIRLADAGIWSYPVTGTMQTIGNFYYKVTLEKDTVIEMVANGHARGYPGNGALVARFFVDETPLSTIHHSDELKIDSYGGYHQQEISAWLPLSLVQMAVVPAGDHVISFRSFTNNGSGGSINGLEVLIKINW